MMSKGDNLNFLNTQTYVLKLNICCDGCKIKVKKLLQKIDGVYTISIDAEKGKVTVSGSASPATLIKKLCKAGKHAELLGAKNGNMSNNKNNSVSSNFHEQLQKLQLQQKGNGNPQKNGAGAGAGGGKDQKGGQQLLQHMKGFQDLKLPQMRDQKNVKFSLPSEDEDGSDYDDDDDDDMYDSEDDYDDDGLDDFEDGRRHSNMKPMKEKKGGGGGKNDKKGGGGGGGEVSMLNKLMGSIGGGGGGHKDGKSGGDKNKKGAPNGKDNNGGKKGGGATGGALPVNFNPKMPMGGQGMNVGKMSAPMGHPMSLSAGGMPPPPGYYQLGGMAAANPYHHQQQQHMAAMQQRSTMINNGPIMQYGQQPMTAYGQPPMGLPHPAYGEPAYAHYFSEENPNSCSVM